MYSGVLISTCAGQACSHGGSNGMQLAAKDQFSHVTNKGSTAYQDEVPM